MQISIVLLLAFMALCPPARAADWSICPGLDEPSAAQAPGTDQPAFQHEVLASNYTYHWSRSPDHRRVLAVSFTRVLPRNRFCGYSLFTNSFGQPSAYVYTGYDWPHIADWQPRLYASVSAGLLYGYVPPFQRKVPLNVGGFSPAIIPAVGMRLSPHLALELQVLGTSAVLFGAKWRY